MDYKNIYYSLIAKRLSSIPTGYVEKHHIVPRSLGGTNEKTNIVTLTAREHFVCHLLLAKMYPKDTLPWIKMQKAISMMYLDFYGNRYCPSKWYTYVKMQLARANSLSQTGSKNSQFGKTWMYNIELKENKKVSKNKVLQYLEKGWTLGRILNWNKIEGKIIKTIKQEETKERKKNLYTNYYKIYNKFGWTRFIELTRYNKSKANLVKQFQKYVLEFKPQNGKKRGNCK